MLVTDRKNFEIRDCVIRQPEAAVAARTSKGDGPARSSFKARFVRASE
jgi:hypothetical protein